MGRGKSHGVSFWSRFVEQQPAAPVREREVGRGRRKGKGSTQACQPSSGPIEANNNICLISGPDCPPPPFCSPPLSLFPLTLTKPGPPPPPPVSPSHVVLLSFPPPSPLLHSQSKSQKTEFWKVVYTHSTAWLTRPSVCVSVVHVRMREDVRMCVSCFWISETFEVRWFTDQLRLTH